MQERKRGPEWRALGEEHKDGGFGVCVYSIYSDMIASHSNTTVLCVWYLNPHKALKMREVGLQSAARADMLTEEEYTPPYNHTLTPARPRHAYTKEPVSTMPLNVAVQSELSICPPF